MTFTLETETSACSAYRNTLSIGGKSYEKTKQDTKSMELKNSAQERARQYFEALSPGEKARPIRLDITNAFTAGEISGHRRAMDEMGYLSATQCVHPEALIIREGQDGITCAKQERITDLEAENKKLGDVVLEMVDGFESYADVNSYCRRECERTEPAEGLLKDHAEIIKQLKQERGE
jgi:hypothetical protein